MTAAADPTWITPINPDLDPQASADGVRLAVKDCIDVAGVVTTAGSPLVEERSEPAAVDAACLAGARAAGARIVGKTNLHELCFGSSGVNSYYGTPVNPIDPGRVPGGSSSGSAVAVATGQADVALGTDTTGSLRTPAACCGVVGFKPTFGVIPVAGTRPLAPSLDTVGVLGRSVADVAAGLTLLDEQLTEGEVVASTTVGRFRLPGTDPSIEGAIDTALLDAGYELVEVDLPGWNAAHDAASTVLYGEALTVNEDLWEHYRSRLGADLVERFLLAETIGPAELGEARAHRTPWRSELADVLGTVGVLALPAMLAFPARVGAQAVPPNPT